jgi:hypothetical protein
VLVPLASRISQWPTHTAHQPTHGTQVCSQTIITPLSLPPQAVLEFRLTRGPDKWRNVYKALLVSDC